MQLGRQFSREVNIGHMERWISLLLGTVLLFVGFLRAFRGLVLAAVGGALLYRGLSGHSFVYQLLGRQARSETARRAWPGGPGIRVEESITINRPVDEIYRFWRDFENLPRFMTHLQSVKTVGERRSHWVAIAPGPLPITVEWEGEIVEERPNELITWRSLPGSQVDTAGSVRFRAAPGDRGTEVRVMLAYSPPLGAAGTVYGRLFNRLTEQQIVEDLRRLKQVLEAGEVPTTEGQPVGAGRGGGMATAAGEALEEPRQTSWQEEATVSGRGSHVAGD